MWITSVSRPLGYYFGHVEDNLDVMFRLNHHDVIHVYLSGKLDIICMLDYPTISFWDYTESESYAVLSL